MRQHAEHGAAAWAAALVAFLSSLVRHSDERNRRLLKDLQLTCGRTGWQCSPKLSQRTGGLTYVGMVELASKANFRHALWQMGEAVAAPFGQVAIRQPLVQEWPATDGPTWSELTARWCKPCP